MKYNTIPEFDKDFKKLLKAYESLETDFENMKETLLETHFEEGALTPPKALVAIQGCCKNDCMAYKIRKFACLTLKSKGPSSGIRVTFVHEKANNQITFIEIYYKGKKENEDKKRLQNFIENIGKTRD